MIFEFILEVYLWDSSVFRMQDTAIPALTKLLRWDVLLLRYSALRFTLVFSTYFHCYWHVLPFALASFPFKLITCFLGCHIGMLLFAFVLMVLELVIIFAFFKLLLPPGFVGNAPIWWLECFWLADLLLWSLYHLLWVFCYLYIGLVNHLIVVLRVTGSALVHYFVNLLIIRL